MSLPPFAVLLPVAIAFPLLVAALLVSFAALMSRTVRDVALLGTTLVEVAIAFALFSRTLGGLPVGYWIGGFAPVMGARSPVAPGIALYADPPAAAVVAMLSAIFLAVIFYAWRYFRVVEEYFHVMLLVLLATMTALVLAADIFTMFVTFELMSVIAYALTAFRVEDDDALTGAFQFAMLGSIASLLMMMGIAFVYATVGSLNLAQISRSLGDTGSPLAAAGLAMVVCGLLFKLTAVPFHFWIVDADTAAPTPVAALSSGAMTAVAAFWIARLTGTVIGPLSPEIGATFGHILLATGIVTVWLGGILAVFQTNLKRLLAFSTISHMGIALIGIGIGGTAALAGAGLYAVTQALVKAALFLLTGLVVHRHGMMDIRAIRRDLDPKHWLGCAFIVGGFALAGAPPFGLWAGKAILEEALPHGILGTALFVTLAGGAILTGGAVIHAALVAFFRIGRPPSYGAPPLKDASDLSEFEADGASPAHTPMTLVAAPLGLLLLAAAVPFLPGAIGHAFQMASVMLDAAAYRATLLDGQVTLRAVPPATLPGITVSLVIAAAALLVPLGWTVLRHELPGARLLRMLQAGHAAMLNDYILWLLVGFTALIGWVLIAV